MVGPRVGKVYGWRRDRVIDRVIDRVGDRVDE